MYSQNDLDEAAGAAYLEAEKNDPVVASLHQMSLDMSRLLFIHQGKGFDNLGIHSVELDEQSVNRIDQRIGSTYESLLKLAPGIKAELSEVWRNYSFVRQRLKVDDKGGASRSASLYLGKGVEMLDMLARNHSQ